MRQVFGKAGRKGKDAVRSGEAIAPELEMDRELAARMLDGDQEGLRLWLARHVAPVHGYVQRRLGPGNEELAVEVTKATFQAAFGRIRSYGKGRVRIPARLWLLRIAGAQLAKRRRAAHIPQAGNKVGRVRRVLATLPPRKQAAIYLALAESLSAEELAAALGVRVPSAMRAVRAALRQADKSLRVPEAASAGEQEGEQPVVR